MRYAEDPITAGYRSFATMSPDVCPPSWDSAYPVLLVFLSAGFDCLVFVKLEIMLRHSVFMHHLHILSVLHFPEQPQIFYILSAPD